MSSYIKNWINNKPEFCLAMITGLSLSIGLAPMIYMVYFERVGSHRPFMIGPLRATSFGDLLCCGNIALLCVFPIISWFLATNYRKMKPDNISNLLFILPVMQFIWGLVSMLPLYWLVGE